MNNISHASFIHFGRKRPQNFQIFSKVFKRPQNFQISYVLLRKKVKKKHIGVCWGWEVGFLVRVGLGGGLSFGTKKLTFEVPLVRSSKGI